MASTTDDKQELKLSLFLLSLIAVLTRDERIPIRISVFNEFFSCENFWSSLFKIVTNNEFGVAVRCYGISLMVNIQRLYRVLYPDGDIDTPSRVYASAVVEAALDMIHNHQSSSPSMNSRVLRICFDYILCVWSARPDRVFECLKKRVGVLPTLVEISAQVLVAGGSEFLGFDPLIVENIETLRKFSNELLNIPQSGISTSLAVLVIQEI